MINLPAWKMRLSAYFQGFGRQIRERRNDLLDLFYPRFCIGCGATLIRDESDLCLSCLVGLPMITESYRPENFIETRFYGRAKIESAASFLYYEKETMSQKILHEIKYHGNKELGRRLGRMFGSRLKGVMFKDVDALIPVPLHANKLKTRGYNQSEWIAKGMADSLERPVWTDVIERVVENSTQTKKSAYERWENVKGIFQLTHQREVEGTHLLIVDDVLTTGSTLEACVLPFKELKNIRISVATLAAVN
ncbi:MAG: ComF family protein [Paludibacteraceae bacterium]|nr:ComF family protein [Paludibacteraceae bacterium]MBR5971196.1 ComF family protein [Paludibacteraceae bacterium]